MAGQAELARVEDAGRVECRFTATSTSNAGPERVAHEPGAVEPDAVVVGEGAAGGQDGAGAGVPGGAVVRPSRRVGLDRPAKVKYRQAPSR